MGYDIDQNSTLKGSTNENINKINNSKFENHSIENINPKIFINDNDHDSPTRELQMK